MAYKVFKKAGLLKLCGKYSSQLLQESKESLNFVELSVIKLSFQSFIFWPNEKEKKS